ncbi:unnamed protein product [Macrosiphum euphorbiae]|uniref:Uncharacterized protein n=1 Tax=Macrosiphum euphorbiae TaxID=13131 RepID=A0AAV0VJ75_9HEMI|nr:unnamed protein product [Macrosiphum euphorbiae]
MYSINAVQLHLARRREVKYAVGPIEKFCFFRSNVLVNEVRSASSVAINLTCNGSNLQDKHVATLDPAAIAVKTVQPCRRRSDSTASLDDRNLVESKKRLRSTAYDAVFFDA